MNPRIQELAAQCGMEPDVLDENEGIIWWLGNSDLEKFAELIIKECAQFVEDTFDFVGEEIIVKEKMLEHFGVE
tara:strand:- start:829 stop:1050 length:222 start_codon:yes stop_codon:yes gene_type:complete